VGCPKRIREREKKGRKPAQSKEEPKTQHKKKKPRGTESEWRGGGGIVSKHRLVENKEGP